MTDTPEPTGQIPSRRSRDLIAFVGLAPLVIMVCGAVLALAALALFYAFAGAGFVGLIAIAVPLLVLGIAGAYAAIASVRAWLWLLFPHKPMPGWAGAGLWLGLSLAIAALAIGLRLHASKAESTWTSQESWLLVAGLAAIAAAGLLLALKVAVRRNAWQTRAFKALEVGVVCIVWMASFGTVPSLERHASDRAAELDAATARALRVETRSLDPFVVALCHDDIEAFHQKLEIIGDEGARDAWTCIPDNIATYLHQYPDRYGVAETRIMFASEAVYWNDRRLFNGTRNGAPCNVAEANLLRRLVDVAPTQLIQLRARGLPTDCTEDDARRTPIWWRIDRHWPAGSPVPPVMLEALRQGGVDLAQADARGARSPLAAHAASAAASR